MTDQDNLQNRIEEILHQVGNGELALNMSPNERNELSQAIIDELGLTMETYVGYDETLDHDVLQRFFRVVGEPWIADESILGVENG